MNGAMRPASLMRVYHIMMKHPQQHIDDAHLSNTVAVSTLVVLMLTQACFEASRLLEHMSVMSQTSNSLRMKLCTMLRHIGQHASGVLSRSCVQGEHLHKGIMLHWLVLAYMQ